MSKVKKSIIAAVVLLLCIFGFNIFIFSVQPFQVKKYPTGLAVMQHIHRL